MRTVFGSFCVGVSGFDWTKFNAKVMGFSGVGNIKLGLFVKTAWSSLSCRETHFEVGLFLGCIRAFSTHRKEIVVEHSKRFSNNDWKIPKISQKKIFFLLFFSNHFYLFIYSVPSNISYHNLFYTLFLVNYDGVNI